MKVHTLKTTTGFFNAVDSGRKPFEVRRNDRDFKVGDLLVLREWDERAGVYLGREIGAVITYLLHEFPGIEPGFAVLGIDTSFRLSRS